MDYTRIVTHPGQAHRDDFIACCVAITKFEITKLDRRDPTPEELDDPTVLVLDVGEVHDPAKGDFDHHQLHRDAPPACALSMFLQSLELYEMFSLMPWLSATEIMDSKGPYALAAHLGCEPEAIFRNLSPIEGAIIEMFGNEEQISFDGGHTTLLAGLMNRLGKQFLDHALALHEQQVWLKENAEIVELGVDDVQMMLVYSSNTKGAQTFRDNNCPDVAIAINYDDRGDGWSLYRFDDDPRVDFSKLEGMEEVLFAHKGGFIAKTKERLDLGKLFMLIVEAVSKVS